MSLSQQTPQSIEIVPLTLHMGAEIRGVDLTKPLPPQQVKEVRDAFLKWKVVFFRNQHLDHAQHVARVLLLAPGLLKLALVGVLLDEVADAPLQLLWRQRVQFGGPRTKFRQRTNLTWGRHSPTCRRRRTSPS